MTLSVVMALILRYFTEIGTFRSRVPTLQHRVKRFQFNNQLFALNRIIDTLGVSTSESRSMFSI